MKINRLLVYLYNIRKNSVRNNILKIVKRLEGGEIYSLTLREIFKKYHQVTVGLYSMGGCFKISYFDECTTVGRYCSIARGARVLTINHRIDFRSTHPFFYFPMLRFTDQDFSEYSPLTIGNDVWMGHNSIILPEVKEIGHGAVIGAGAVVNKDVPPYGIVVGNPGRVVRFRFPPPIIEELLQSKWWEKPIDELRSNRDQYCRPMI